VALPPSTKYPGKVFFFTSEPEALILAGYDSLRIEKRKDCYATFAPETKGDKVCTLKLELGVYNYFYVDENADVKNEFRAILQNSVTPGTPVDIPQPVQRAVDTSYEQIMTIKELKEIYIWGQDPAFIAEDGRFQPDYAFAFAVKTGIAKVEMKIGIRILPTVLVDKHDYMREHGIGRGNYLQFHLDEFPIVGTPVARTNFPGSPKQEFPETWLRFNKETGDLFIVPDGSANPTPITAPLSGKSFIPDAFEVEYAAGFQPGKVPADLMDAIGMEASFQPFNVGGDLVGGAGLAGSSLSLDGLSQSITTTNSSTNAGFGARLLVYGKQLKDYYNTAIPFYRGLRMHVA
jgi:hypothetical protein